MYIESIHTTCLDVLMYQIGLHHMPELHQTDLHYMP